MGYLGVGERLLFLFYIWDILKKDYVLEYLIWGRYLI